MEVPNSYSEEKEDALSALGELATNTGSVAISRHFTGYKILMESLITARLFKICITLHFIFQPQIAYLKLHSACDFFTIWLFKLK